MFRQHAMDTRLLAVLGVGLALNLPACGEDAAGDQDSSVTSPPPTETQDGGAPVTRPDDANDAAGPVIVPKDAGPDAMPTMDGSITIITPIEPKSDAAVSVIPEDASVTGDAVVSTADGGPASDGGLPPWAVREDLGKGDGKDVITIGDSWMAGILGGSGIQAALDRENTDYRHYAVTATTLLSGQIPGQYDRAKRANPKITTVIMTAGGNDVMFSGGCNTKQECQVISDKISDGLDKLWSQMATDGVKDVVYIQYANVAGATPPELRGMAKPVAVCYSGKINCHSMETSSIVTKDSDLIDGIHPNSAANTRIAKAVLTLMETRKIRR